VGVTERSLVDRWKEHVDAARHGSTLIFHRAIRKHGHCSFDVSVIEQCETENELASVEIRLIEEKQTFAYDHPNTGYNMTRGGDGIHGYKHTDAKRRMSIARKGKKLPPRSKEYRLHMSIAKKGTGTGPNLDARGWHHIRESKEKISEVLRQRVRKTRSVIQYDMNRNVLATYTSAKLAARVVNGHDARIGDCCRGSRDTHAGFKWSYAEQKGLR